MQCRALAFRELPHQPPLHLAFVDDFPRVKPFFAHEPTLENAARLAATLHYPQSRRSAVAAILREQNQLLGAEPAVLQNIARFEQGSAAVVTGQQVALFVLQSALDNRGSPVTGQGRCGRSSHLLDGHGRP